jgi:hypothetical protein
MRFRLLISLSMIGVLTWAVPVTGQILMEVYADSTMYDPDGGVNHDGFLVKMSGDDDPTSFFVFEEMDGPNRMVRFYATRDEDDGIWETYPAGNYFVKQENLNVGDTWTWLYDEDSGENIAEVVQQEDIEVPAGIFATFRVVATSTTPPEEISERTWFANGVGIVRLREGDHSTWLLLADYHIEGGTGYLPVAVGNWWLFDAPLSNQTTTWGRAKVLYAD